MVRIHQGALVTPTVLSESWEPFLFCVLKLVLKIRTLGEEAGGIELALSDGSVGFSRVAIPVFCWSACSGEMQL